MVARNVDLLGYLPLFVAEYREMKHISAAENPEFKLLFGMAERLLNNQFAVSCDEQGIKRFEELLGIRPAPTDSLEIRILRVLDYAAGGMK